MLVQIGNLGEWVNPKYVTSIQRVINPHTTRIQSKVWVVGNAGYGTYEIYSYLTHNEVAAKLNGGQIDEE